MSATLTFDYDSPLGDAGTRRLELGPTGPAGVGVPAGGATGQVLAKSSGTDYATGWASLSITSADITDSTATGRAVLTAADAAAARSAIGAGTGNGNALTSGTLAQFAATTSAELAGVLTDETGFSAGAVAVFSVSPTFGTQITTPRLITSAAGSIAAPAIGWNLSGGNHGWYVFGSGTPTTAFIGVVSNSNLHTAIRSNLTSYTGSTNIGWVTGSDPTLGQVVGLARLDDNTVEVNNGTRTASGGALRGLSVSSLTCPGEINTGGTYYSVRTLRLGTPNDSHPSIYVRNNLGSTYFANGTVSCIAFRVNPQAATTPAGADLQFGNSNTTALPRMVLNHNQIAGYTAILNAAVTVDGSFTVTGTTTLGTYTVATLPSASANAGAFAQVTDSNSTTNGGIVAGGGANRVPVFSNGTNWIIK